MRRYQNTNKRYKAHRARNSGSGWKGPNRTSPLAHMARPKIRIIQRFICLGTTRRLITNGLVDACPVRQSVSMQRAAAWGIWSILKAMQIQATATTCPATFGKASSNP